MEQKKKDIIKIVVTAIVSILSTILGVNFFG